MNEFIVSVNKKRVKIGFSENGKLKINDLEHEYTLSALNGNTYLLKIDNETFLVSVKPSGNAKYFVTLKGQVFETLVRTVLQDRATSLISATAVQHSKVTVKAPMPGMIVKVKKTVGEKVVQGDSVLILEAMKMENDIRSPSTGSIKEIMAKEGKAVEKGSELFTIE